MCGILGIYNFNKEDSIKKSELRKGSEVISHRGPDAEGYFISDNIGMACRRLSIIDLSSKANQPLTNEDESIWLVFNGEVYNFIELRNELIPNGHHFSSNTDAEVIIHAYEEFGQDCVKRFNGMWAFVLFDKRKKEFFCSRDRLGVKPFYYHRNRKRFVCSSEIKSLLTLSDIRPEENQGRVYDFILYGYLDTSNETMFKDILQLPPAHNMLIKDGNISLYKYWDLADRTNNYDCVVKDDNHIDQRFRELLYNSVKIRTRSDVPIYTLLSGGLDSSAIVSVLDRLKKDKKLNMDIKTISVVHDKKKINEYRYVKDLLRDRDIHNKQIRFNEADFLKEMENIIYIQDEPFPYLSLVNHYFIMKEMKREGIKVLLSGQGADESMYGYIPMLFSYYFADLFTTLKFSKLFREVAFHLKLKEVSLAVFFLQMFKGLFPRPIASFFKSAIVEKSLRFVKPAIQKRHGIGIYKFDAYKKNYTSLNNHMYRMLRYESLPKILHFSDRNSMAFSIEERAPFLDFNLLEFLFSLSNDQKVKDGVSKIIMRRSLKGILPYSIVHRKTKLGFNVPEEDWIKSDELFNFIMRAENTRYLKDSIINEKVFKEEYVKYNKGRSGYNQTLWRVINYALWRKRFNIN